MPRDLFHRVAKRGAGGLESALSNLSQSLTINGVTKTPLFRYEGNLATTTAWVATVGSDLAIADIGAEVTPDQETPLLSTTDKMLLFNDGKNFEAATAAYADLTTDDIVFEAVLQASDSATRGIVSKGNPTGWSFDHASSALRFYIDDGGAGSAAVTSAVVTDGAYYHFMAFMDRSGSGVAYLNSVAGTPAVLTGHGGSITTTDKLRIGATATSGFSEYDRGVMLAQMWNGIGWLDSHLQPTIAAARSKALFGANTDETRDSLAYLHKPVSGVKKYFLVGKNWMRLSQDVGGSPAYQKEAAATNTAIYSNVFPATAGITVTQTAESPFQSELGSVLVEDGSNGTHYSQQTVNVSTGKDYVVKFFIKPTGRTALRISSSSVSNWALRVFIDFAPATPAVTNTYNETATVTDIGDGWYEVEIVVGTTSTGAANLYFHTSNDDGTTLVYTGSLGLEAMELIHLGVEEGAAATSPILSSGATTTRLADA